MAEIRGDMVKAEWGQQIRNYVLHPYRLAKDTRTGEGGEGGGIQPSAWKAWGGNKSGVGCTLYYSGFRKVWTCMGFSPIHSPPSLFYHTQDRKVWTCRGCWTGARRWTP